MRRVVLAIGFICLSSIAAFAAGSCSVTIANANTALNLPIPSSAHGFTVANADNTSGGGEPVWMSLAATAAAGDINSAPLAAPTATTYAALASFTGPPNSPSKQPVSVVAATAGHKIFCAYW